MTLRSMPLCTALAGLVAAVLIALWALPAWSMEVGFYGGMTIANLGGDSDEFRLMIQDQLESEAGGTWDSSRDSRVGPAVGGFVAFPVHRDLLFQPEVHYVPRGSEYNWTGITGNIVSIDGVIEAAYLEFPLTVRWTPALGGAVRPVLLFGPSVGVNLGDGTFSLSVGEAGASQDVPMTGMSFGLVMGGGIEFDMNRAASLLVEGRYTLGLTNLADDPHISLPGREVAVLAGVSFHYPKHPRPPIKGVEQPAEGAAEPK